MLRAMTPVTQRDPSRNRPPSLWEVALAATCLALLLATSGWFWLQRAQRDAVTPRSADFSRAAKLLKGEVRPGDAFAIVPGWSAGQRWRFRRVWRNEGVRFDEAMVFADPLTPWDLDGFERLWLLTTHGRADRAAAAKLGKVLAQHQLSEGVALAQVALPKSRTVYDFKQRLSDAKVARAAPGGQTEDCRWNNGAHRCSGAWWRNVKAGLQEVGNTRRRCIFVQPHPSKGTLKLRYDDLPAATELQGRFGNQLWGVRYDEGSDVKLVVRVDGKVLHTSTVTRGDFRWHSFAVRLPAGFAGKSLTFEVSAEDATWRQACFDARLIGGVKAAK